MLENLSPEKVVWIIAGIIIVLLVICWFVSFCRRYNLLGSSGRNSGPWEDLDGSGWSISSDSGGDD